MADIKKAGSNGIVDTANSSTSILTAGSVFTGSFVEILDYHHITILVSSDVASATDGLEIQHSSDGVNVDDTDKFTIPAATGKIFSFGPESKYYRIKYTNGGTNQSSFRLQVILKTATQKPSSHRIKDSIASDDDAELTKAILAGQDGTGAFKNVRLDTAGRLLVSSDIATPVDTVAVSQTARSSISSSSDTIYTITNGKTLVIQLFEAGAEANSIGGSQVLLFEDPNGDLSVLNLISAIYVNGSSFQNSVTDEFVGNGTRRIVMRRNPLAGGSREIYGRWKGFEQ